jgi:hypothetical protein
MSVPRTTVAVALCTIVSGPVLSAQTQEQPRRAQPGWPCVAAIDPSYVAVAEGTGGQVFMFDPAEVGRSSVLMIGGLKHEELVFHASGSLAADGTRELEFPVDGAVQSLLLSVSLQCLQRIEIVGPSGRQLQATDSGVDDQQFRAGRIVTVPQPDSGTWRVRLSGRGLFFVSVRAKSDLSLDEVRFVREGGRPGHEGLFPTREPPRGGVAQLIEVVVSGAAEHVRARLVSSEFENLGGIPLRVVSANDEEQRFLGDVRPRVDRFRVVVSGTDARGLPFQRVHAPLFSVR